MWPWAVVLALAATFSLPARGGTLQLLSTPDPAQAPPAGGGGDSLAPIISPDGRYVLFASLANNLVVTSNGLPIPVGFPYRLNVYLRDRTNLTTALVSVNVTGIAGGNDNCLPTGLSANGRYALFESGASDLVPGDTNNAADVFVRDVVLGTTTLVSVSTNGGSANGVSRGSVITPDGRCVAFVSLASNLVAADTNGIADVFVRDLQTGVTTLASVGAQGPGVSGSEFPDLTPDGRYVAFYSTATNLVPGAVNSSDIYVRDLTTGTTTWASRDALAAVQSAMPATAVVAYNHTLSTNGQYVAFEAAPFSPTATSWAGVILRCNVFSGVTDVVHTNATASGGPLENIRTLDMTPDGGFVTFLANHTNSATPNTCCVYVWDAAAGAMTLASGDLSNNVPVGSICDWPRLDASGRHVCFVSSAANLVTSAPAGDLHAYVRDLQAGATAVIDADTNGVGSALTLASAPQISADGRFVVFEAPDGSLVPDDRNGDYDVFARSLASGTTELVSVRNATLPTVTPNGASSLSAYSVSSNGQYVAFASSADNLVPGDTNGYTDIFVHDAVLETNVWVSVATNGAPADGPSTEPAISGNGRYVAFTSSADNLVAGDTNNAQDIFVRDLQAGVTTLVSVNSSAGGSGNGASHSPKISADGRYVLFLTAATNLTPVSFSPGYDMICVRDLQNETTYALGQAVYLSSAAADMTPDGTFVAFYGKLPQDSFVRLYVWASASASLVYTNSAYGVSFKIGVSSDGNRIAYATNDLYSTSPVIGALDRVSGTTWTIGSLTPNMHAGLRFSGDGRFLTYAAKIGRTNQVYLYDLEYSTNFLVSHAYDSSSAAYGDSDWPEISSDGRFVAYRSAAADIVPGDTNGAPDLFLYDRVTQSTTCLTANRFGTSVANSRSVASAFSGDGQTLVLESWGSDLAAQDFNQGSDLFACQLYASGQLPTFSVTIVSGGAGQGPWLMWPVVPGRNYGVEFKNTLDDPEWQPLNQGLTILGTQGYLKDFSAGAVPRFYRVVAY